MLSYNVIISSDHLSMKKQTDSTLRLDLFTLKIVFRMKHTHKYTSSYIFFSNIHIYIISM